jgi:hypothetical protein
MDEISVISYLLVYPILYESISFFNVQKFGELSKPLGKLVDSTCKASTKFHLKLDLQNPPMPFLVGI